MSTWNHEAAPVLPGVRRFIWLVLLLAIANGIYLYVFPGHAARGYAWSVNPPLGAAFMGAGYLAGVVSGVLALFAARYWRSIRALVPGFFLLTTFLLVATIIHADLFRWDYPLTWVWAVIYVTLPLALPLAWIVQGSGLPAVNPAPDGRLLPVRWALGATGVLAMGLGLTLFAAPASFADIWPWQLTALMGRVHGSWYMLIGGTVLASALTLRQPHELPIPSLTMLAFAVLLLLLPLYPGGAFGGATSLWTWVGLHLLLAFCLAWAAFRGMALMRELRQRL